MSILGKILGMWMLGKTVSSTTPILLRLITAVAAITILAIVGFLVFALLMVGVVWAGYLQLLAHDFTEAQAAGIISGTLIIALVIIGSVVRRYSQQVMLTLRQLAFVKAPVSGRVSFILDEFVRGYRA